MSIATVFILLAIFQVKHFIADYPLQIPYMLKKFLPDWNFFLPLLAHVSIHGLITFTILYFFAPQLWWLAGVDMLVHFIMDRVKAGPKYLGRYKALSADEFKKAFDTYQHAEDPEARGYARSRLRDNTFFWWSLGLDQMVHHLTDLFIVYMIVS